MYLYFMYQKIVAQPKPVAMLRCESGFGRVDRKSLLQRPSCQVIRWLVSLGLKWWRLSPPDQLQPEGRQWWYRTCLNKVLWFLHKKCIPHNSGWHALWFYLFVLSRIQPHAFVQTPQFYWHSGACLWAERQCTHSESLWFVQSPALWPAKENQ